MQKEQIERKPNNNLNKNILANNVLKYFKLEFPSLIKIEFTGKQIAKSKND